MSKAPTKAERAYIALAVDDGCILCWLLRLGCSPAQFHHPRTGIGAARRAPHSEGIPLCWQHHLGDLGIHGMGRKAFERHYGYTESELTALTKERVSNRLLLNVANVYEEDS